MSCQKHSRPVFYFWGNLGRTARTPTSTAYNPFAAARAVCRLERSDPSPRVFCLPGLKKRWGRITLLTWPLVWRAFAKIMTDPKSSPFRRRAGRIAGLSLAFIAFSIPAGAQEPSTEPGPSSKSVSQAEAPVETEPDTFSRGFKRKGKGSEMGLVEWGAQTVDILFLRPMGAVATLGGVAAFAVTTPFVMLSTAVDLTTSWDIFVQAPLEYTIDRPLGDL